MSTLSWLRGRRWSGLGSQVIGLALAAVLVTGVLIGWLLTTNNRQALEDSVHNRNLATVVAAGNLAAQFVDVAQTSLKHLSDGPIFGAAVLARDAATTEIHMSQLMQTVGRFDSISVYSPDGVGWASGLESSWSFLGGPVSDREWFQNVLRTKQPYLGLPLISRETGHAVVPFAIPILDAADAVSSVLVGNISISILSDAISRIETGESNRLSIVDTRLGGSVLAASDPSLILRPVREFLSQGTLNLTAAGQQGTIETKDLQGRSTLIAYTHVSGLQWLALIEEPATKALASVNSATRHAIEIVCGVLLAALVAGLILSRRITAPLRRLVKGAYEVANGNLDYKTGISRKDEVGAVSQAFDYMTEELKRTLVSRDELAAEVAERRRAEEARLASEELLRQSQKMEAVGQLAGGIAHDFNNLLTAIIGYSDLALASAAGQDATVRPDLREIKRAAERASSLTRQILAFSRRQALQPAVVSLNDIVTDVEPLLRRTLGEDIDLVIHLDKSLAKSELDINQFEQVIMNLALNARDASPLGGRLTIETHNVELGEEYCRSHPEAVPGDHVMLSVSDTGVGMDEDTMSRIFEPFFTTKAPGEGTGLGLSTVYGIVRQSDGSIDVTSTPGEGTTFRVYLPTASKSATRTDTQVAVASAVPGGETILVVEDEPALRRLVERVLSGLGYHVLTAGTANEAVAAALDAKIDLLLTDVVLPGSMQGNDLAELLAGQARAMSVLYMSGYPRDAIVHAGRLDKGVHYLEKPFTPDALAKKVGEVLTGEAGV
jgi:signal transduction histidine kinase